MFNTKVLNVSQSYLFFYYGFHKDNDNSTFIKMLVLFAAILKIRILNNL